MAFRLASGREYHAVAPAVLPLPVSVTSRSTELPLCFPVLGNHLRDGNGFLHRHGGIHNDAHFAAAIRYVIRSDIIRTAEHKLDVAVADDFGPKIVGIPVLKLTKTLNGEHDPNIPGAYDA